jgi:hypothetical protein
MAKATGAIKNMAIKNIARKNALGGPEFPGWLK